MAVKSCLFLFAIFFAVNAAPSIPNNCPERLNAMDENMKVALLVTDPNAKIFQSERELDEEYCKPIKDRIKIIGEYKPCLKAFPRQLFAMVMSNAKKNVKAVCTTPEQREELVKNMNCFTNETLPDLLQITHDVTSLVEYLVNVTDIDRIIPGMCCGYQILVRDIKPKIDAFCTAQGVGESGSEYFLGLLKAAISDALDMMCGNYDTADACNKKVPDVVEEFHMAMNATRNTSYTYTAIVPFLKIIDRIDNAKNLNY